MAAGVWTCAVQSGIQGPTAPTSADSLLKMYIQIERNKIAEGLRNPCFNTFSGEVLCVLPFEKHHHSSKASPL